VAHNASADKNAIKMTIFLSFTGDQSSHYVDKCQATNQQNEFWCLRSSDHTWVELPVTLIIDLLTLKSYMDILYGHASKPGT